MIDSIDFQVDSPFGIIWSEPHLIFLICASSELIQVKVQPLWICTVCLSALFSAKLYCLFVFSSLFFFVFSHLVLPHCHRIIFDIRQNGHLVTLIKLVGAPKVWILESEISVETKMLFKPFKHYNGIIAI